MTFSSTYCSNWRVSHSYSRAIRSTLLRAFSRTNLLRPSLKRAGERFGPEASIERIYLTHPTRTAEAQNFVPV
jgi:fructose-bisphosphate aldolase class 1